MSNSTNASRTRNVAAPRIAAWQAVAGVLTAAAVAAAVNALIAVITVAAGASEDFEPLMPSSYVSLTVLGVLAGTAGWVVVRRWADRPAATLRWLVPTVVGVSLLPDVALLITDSRPHTTGLGVAGLMAMHLATAAVTIPLLARVLPLPNMR